MGLFEVVFLIFLTLKLTNKIDWSWWAVCSPLLIELGLVILFFMFFGTAWFVAFFATT